MNSSSENSLNTRARIGYGSGDFALNLFWQGVGFYLLFFYTDILKLDATTAGLIFACGGVWDAASDVGMGYYAERSRKKQDIYRPFILYGAVPLALCFVAVFSPVPFDDGWPKILWIVLCLFLFRSFYTIVAIPYSSLGARLTRDPKERIRISAVRMYCAFLGGLTVIGLATGLQKFIPDEHAFLIMSVICGVLAVGLLYFCYRETESAKNFKVYGNTAASMKDVAKSLKRNKPFQSLAYSLVCITIGMTFFNSMILYYFTYVLQDRFFGNAAIFIISGTPLVMIPVWSAYALKTNKKHTWKIGGLMALIGLGVLYAVGDMSPYVALAAVLVIACGFTSFAVLQWSMLPDTIDYGEYKFNIRNESFVIGILSAIQKTSAAAIVLMLGIALDMIGYEAGVVQSQFALSGIQGLIAFVPFIAIGMSIIFVSSYTLNAAVMNEMRQSAENAKDN